MVRVEQSVEAILRWSWWRRWHQAWARCHHYQRRGRDAPTPQPASVPVVALPVDAKVEAEVAWRCLEAVLACEQHTGRPYIHARRVVFDAIVHVMDTNCGWRALPSTFPPWQTVYAQLRQWRKSGIWERIWFGLDQPHPISELQL